MSRKKRKRLLSTAILSSGRERRDGFAYCPHRWCLKMHIRWLRGKTITDQKRKRKKVLKRALSSPANGFLPFQEAHSHPLLMPLLEDPKMELKTFLLPLRLGLLTAFHQSAAEVNIFTLKVFPPSLFLLGCVLKNRCRSCLKKKKKKGGLLSKF